MTRQVDRRKFLGYTGAVGAATGALWVAPSVLGSSSAFALNSASACAYAGVLHWSDASWPSGGTGNDAWVSGDLDANGIPVAPDNSSNGASKSFIAKVGGTGNSYVWVRVTVTAVGPPAANSGGTGGAANPGPYGPDEYVLAAKTASSNPSTQSGAYEVEVEFFSEDTLTTAATVSNLSFEIRDIDGTPSSYYENVWITGPTGVGSSLNTNIGGDGSSGNPWHNTTSTSNLIPPAGDITVSIPSASSFTVHGEARGTGKNLDHGWSLGQISWDC